MVRRVFIGIVALYMMLSPAVKQVFGVDTDIVRSWIMFSNVARDVCAVRVERVDERGERQVVDRYELLAADRTGETWRQLRSIEGEAEMRKVAAALCIELGWETDLRIWSRCATTKRQGWYWVWRGDENLCAAAATRAVLP